MNSNTLINIVKKQEDFFLTGKTRSIEFRLEQLKKLKLALQSNELLIYQALDQDLKRSNFESYIAELMPIYSDLDKAIENLRCWNRPKRVPTPLTIWPGKSEVIYEPYGVSLIIAPWNYPIQLAILPLIGAMSAGNCAVLKPSEFTVYSQNILGKLIKENFSEEYLCVIEGDELVSQNLLKEKFNFIFFTGSTRVGKEIMKAAANHLTPVCLELGGKSPCIVDETASIDKAAKSIIWGKFFNCGQTCIAPDYVYVHKSKANLLLERMKFYIQELYGTEPIKSKSLGKIVSVRHFQRLKNFISTSCLYYGGEFDEESLQISPTLIYEANWNLPIMREEIFGPILPILTYESRAELKKILLQQDSPLAFYLYSNDENFIDDLVGNIRFGGGCINDCILHFSNSGLPFGGVGLSGIGAYHGKHSFETFSHKKSLFTRSRLLTPSLHYPPYTEKKYKLVHFLFKLFSGINLP
jgi:aldehyde dehydrogenase (NAD+)